MANGYRYTDVDEFVSKSARRPWSAPATYLPDVVESFIRMRHAHRVFANRRRHRQLRRRTLRQRCSGRRV